MGEQSGASEADASEADATGAVSREAGSREIGSRATSSAGAAPRRSGTFGPGAALDERRPPAPTRAGDDDATQIESRAAIDTALSPEVIADRYEVRSILGEGGMGEVRLVWDRFVGRELAMKVLRPSRLGSPRARARFLREAHVQGYLDHPGVVPVHEVGVLPTGEPYFTMKRVRGVTLHEVLEGLRAGDAKLARRFDRRRLVAALAQACLAVDYAHSRGVVHRDLKPENVMLGDFGEVYVLDWGVARIVCPDAERVTSQLVGTIIRDEAHDVLGTPGYMPPEQIDHPSEVEAPADVYALGAILFELLTLEPLHPGHSVRELTISTRDGADARCSLRAPDADVPAELEALCLRATHYDPAKRPLARELHEELESFLDGAREDERRKLTADLHLRAAKQLLEQASGSGMDALTAQRDAIRGLGRALAADPHNREALERLVDTLARPVEGELPPDAETALREEEERQRQVTARVLQLGRVSWLVYVPLVAWMGIRDSRMVGVAIAAVVVSALCGWLVERARPPRPWMRTVVAVVAMATMMPVATLFSPLVLLPALLAASIPTFMVNLDRVGRFVAVGAACLAAIVPLLLEIVGALPPSIRVSDGVITILPRMTEFPEGPTLVVLTVLSLVPLVTSAFLLARVRAELDAARRRIHGHLWRLRQLMPS